jgi:hypothetical protein
VKRATLRNGDTLAVGKVSFKVIKES